MGELVGKTFAIDLGLGQGSDQDIQGFVLCHLKKAFVPPVIHHVKKFCVRSSVFVTTHSSYVVSKKYIGVYLGEFPKLLDKVPHLVITHLPTSHMVQQFVNALLSKEALNLPAVAHPGPRFGVTSW